MGADGLTLSLPARPQSLEKASDLETRFFLIEVLFYFYMRKETEKENSAIIGMDLLLVAPILGQRHAPYGVRGT